LIHRFKALIYCVEVLIHRLKASIDVLPKTPRRLFKALNPFPCI
jgi:hypothetical protein